MHDQGRCPAPVPGAFHPPPRRTDYRQRDGLLGSVPAAECSAVEPAGRLAGIPAVRGGDRVHQRHVSHHAPAAGGHMVSKDQLHQ